MKRKKGEIRKRNVGKKRTKKKGTRDYDGKEGGKKETEINNER